MVQKGVYLSRNGDDRRQPRVRAGGATLHPSKLETGVPGANRASVRHAACVRSASPDALSIARSVLECGCPLPLSTVHDLIHSSFHSCWEWPSQTWKISSSSCCEGSEGSAHLKAVEGNRTPGRFARWTIPRFPMTTTPAPPRVHSAFNPECRPDRTSGWFHSHPLSGLRIRGGFSR